MNDKKLNLNDIIAEYLGSNRRLVVPDFGVFVAKESGELLFSELLRTDDGVLTGLLAARGLNETAVTIDRFVFEVRHELEAYGYCRLGELGTLRLEPATKSLKLYQVKSVEPQSEPTPQPAPKVEKVEPAVEKPTATPTAPTEHRRVVVKSRKRVDTIMIVAIVILLGALVAIGYGFYVSRLGVVDDAAAMDALRVIPEQINE